MSAPTSITYRCTRCGAATTSQYDETTVQLTCNNCQATLNSAAVKISDEGRLETCIACNCAELFVRKDFPQRLGVTIVAVGLGLSCITWLYHQLIATFAILFATALVDLALYVVMGEVVECYRCHAQYRGVENPEASGPFDLEIHERHRQTEARKAQLANTNTTDEGKHS